jgi:hypothetical protein
VNNSKTILVVVFLMAGALLTTTAAVTTMIPAAYAGGDNDNGDGNKNKAEDDSAAAIADCDDNDVELARFLCIALATNNIEIETEPPSEEPPEEGLVICKVVEDPNQEVEPDDFSLILTDSSGFQSGLIGQPPPDCNPPRPVGPGGPEEGEMSPGEYEVVETPDDVIPTPDAIEVEGDCVQDPTNPQRATGEIQEGESQTCTFINIYEGGDG